MEKQIFGKEKKNKKWWLVGKKQILGVEKNGDWKNKY